MLQRPLDIHRVHASATPVIWRLIPFLSIFHFIFRSLTFLLTTTTPQYTVSDFSPLFLSIVRQMLSPSNRLSTRQTHPVTSSVCSAHPWNAFCVTSSPSSFYQKVILLPIFYSSIHRCNIRWLGPSKLYYYPFVTLLLNACFYLLSLSLLLLHSLRILIATPATKPVTYSLVNKAHTHTHTFLNSLQMYLWLWHPSLWTIPRWSTK